jgi:hypothetical protein
MKSAKRSKSRTLKEEYANHTKNHSIIRPKYTALMVDWESFRTGSKRKYRIIAPYNGNSLSKLLPLKFLIKKKIDKVNEKPIGASRTRISLFGTESIVISFIGIHVTTTRIAIIKY